MEYNATSTAANPLTAPIPRDPSLTPAESAVSRFAIHGNAIVTGGAGGLGLAATRALLEHGAAGVCIFDLEPSFAFARSALDSLRAEFPERTLSEEVVDVASEPAVAAAVARAAALLGSVDVLLCYAGVVSTSPAIDMDLEAWNAGLSVNVTGGMLCAKYAAKQMIKQGTAGSIVLVASIAGYKSLFPLYTAAYSTSKFAVIGLTTNLAGEWARYGIRVNSICPGFMATNMLARDDSAPGIASYIERTPLARMGHPDELTGPVVMLCSEAGRYITGTNILVDGGNHVY